MVRVWPQPEKTRSTANVKLGLMARVTQQEILCWDFELTVLKQQSDVRLSLVTSSFLLAFLIRIFLTFACLLPFLSPNRRSRRRK